jgi:hypothetical protein
LAGPGPCSSSSSTRKSEHSTRQCQLPAPFAALSSCHVCSLPARVVQLNEFKDPGQASHVIVYKLPAHNMANRLACNAIPQAGSSQEPHPALLAGHVSTSGCSPLLLRSVPAAAALVSSWNAALQADVAAKHKSGIHTHHLNNRKHKAVSTCAQLHTTTRQRAMPATNPEHLQTLKAQVGQATCV